MWVFSSAGERFLHTEEVVGSTPITPTNAVLAQLVEQLPCKHQAVGSSPIDGTTLLNPLKDWSIQSKENGYLIN